MSTKDRSFVFSVVSKNCLDKWPKPAKLWVLMNSLSSSKNRSRRSGEISLRLRVYTCKSLAILLLTSKTPLAMIRGLGKRVFMHGLMAPSRVESLVYCLFLGLLNASFDLSRRSCLDLGSVDNRHQLDMYLCPDFQLRLSISEVQG